MTNVEFKIQLESRTVAFSVSESEYWLLLLKELCPDVDGLPSALAEAGELTRIFDKIRRTMGTKE